MKRRWVKRFCLNPGLAAFTTCRLTSAFHAGSAKRVRPVRSLKSKGSCRLAATEAHHAIDPESAAFKRPLPKGVGRLAFSLARPERSVEQTIGDGERMSKHAASTASSNLRSRGKATPGGTVEAM